MAMLELCRCWLVAWKDGAVLRCCGAECAVRRYGDVASMKMLVLGKICEKICLRKKSVSV